MLVLSGNKEIIVRKNTIFSGYGATTGVKQIANTANQLTQKSKVITAVAKKVVSDTKTVSSQLSQQMSKLASKPLSGFSGFGNYGVADVQNLRAQLEQKKKDIVQTKQVIAVAKKVVATAKSIKK